MIIAFTGKKRSGKSTACEYIESLFPNAERVNFKDAMIREISERFPNFLVELCNLMEKLDYDGMNPWTPKRLFKDKPLVFRAFMQNYGTELRRGDNDLYWVDQWYIKAREFNFVTVDDVRFANEANAVRQLGGVIIKLNREGLENNDSHTSETEMDSIIPDYTVNVADGDLDGLKKQLDAIIDTIHK